MREPTHRPRVVVGVDGSDDARAALAEAVKEAALRDAELDVVHVWEPPLVIIPIPPVANPLDLARHRHAAEKLLDSLVDGVLDRAERKPARVERVVAEDHSVSRVLVDAAKGADLLVVGSRGHGGFAGLLLGSVSQQCVHHAGCPVLVVRASEGTGS